MGRPKSVAPAIRYHISGQSICQIDGVTFYLGKHQSPESLARYAVLVREYQANGLTLPPGFDSQELQAMAEGFAKPLPVVHLENEPVLVSHIVAKYREYIKVRYGKPYQATDLARRLAICDLLDQHDGGLVANEFGSRKLKEYRQSIQRAAKTAKVPIWSPYQVRHLAGVTVGELLQLEAAKALLGHSDIRTTQIYSKATMRQSIEAAKRLPRMDGTTVE